MFTESSFWQENSLYLDPRQELQQKEVTVAVSERETIRNSEVTQRGATAGKRLQSSGKVLPVQWESELLRRGCPVTAGAVRNPG